MQAIAATPLTRFPAPSQGMTAGRTQPFRDAEEAWLWTMSALVARREGARY